MKIRNSFVSNSSSSSFCIMGAILDEYTEIDGLDTVGGISTFYDKHIIGLSINCMDEEETLSQFRARVKLLLEDNNIDTSDINFRIDGGYNG